MSALEKLLYRLECPPAQNNGIWKSNQIFTECKEELLYLEEKNPFTEGWCLEPGEGSPETLPLPLWLPGLPWPTAHQPQWQDPWIPWWLSLHCASKPGYEHSLLSPLEFSLERECIGQPIRSSLLGSFISQCQLMGLWSTWQWELVLFDLLPLDLLANLMF